jgi:FHA domain
MTATFTCPDGHPSTTSDYCDQCGARIAGVAPSPITTEVPAVTPGPAPATPSPAIPGPATQGAPEPCPACSAARVGTDRFCEGCGYDFVAGATPAQAAAAGAAETAAAWDAVVSADRAYFDRVASAGVDFPPHCPDRRFPLSGPELRIGRRSASRGIQPDIDLTGAPEDSAISHLHALLVRGTDGSYSLVDPGSTNGTTVNDDPAPVGINVAVPLSDGDRIHLGAWTTITIHARLGPDG